MKHPRKTRKKKIIAIVQARMGSARLPGKVLMPILRRPMLWHIVNRLNYSSLIDQTIIATTAKDRDKPIREMAEENKFAYYAGSEEDLIDRFYQASKTFNPYAIVRITADCPLVDPEITDKVISFFLKNKERFDYVSNARPRPSFPQGLDAEIFSFSLLEKLWKEINNPLKREWFTSVIFENPDKYRIFCVKNNVNLSHIRLTVDYPEDLELIKFIYQNLYSDEKCFFLEDILGLLANNQDIFASNKKYSADDQYKQLKKRRLL